MALAGIVYIIIKQAVGEFYRKKGLGFQYLNRLGRPYILASGSILFSKTNLDN